MSISRLKVASYLLHIVPGEKSNPTITVPDEAKKLGIKYGDFLHHLTLFALAFVKAFKVQGTEAQQKRWYRKLHIFQSLSKAWG